MSARVRNLMQERTEREQRIAELEQQLERSLENQRLIGETLVRAREEAEAIRAEARLSAEQELRAAREQGVRVVAGAEQAANDRVAGILLAAQQERDAIVNEGRKERQALLDEAAKARAFIDQTHEQLSDFLMAAVRWYEQAKPSTERGGQGSSEPASAPNETRSIPSDWTAAMTRESQSASSSTGRSEE